MKTLLCPLRYDPNMQGYYVYENYITMFQKINYQLIFITPSNLSTLYQLSDLCDGLLLIGGKDVDPIFYQRIRHPKTNLERKIDEDLEFFLIDYFHKKNKPIIGICRGIQTINVYFGGTLIQDLDSLPIYTCNHMQDKNSVYSHPVFFQKDSLFYRYFGDHIMTNSFHHQSIETIAPNCIISGLSEDGMIEAIEANHVIGVQWHPEKVNDDNQDIFLQMIQSLF